MSRILTWMILGVFVLVVAAIIGLADAGRARSFFAWVGEVPAGDKIGHFILFGTMAFLANTALKGARLQWGTVTVMKGSLFVLIPTVLEEFSQLYFPSRTFDLLDLVADGAGIFLGGILAVLLLQVLSSGTVPIPARRAENSTATASSVESD